MPECKGFHLSHDRPQRRIKNSGGSSQVRLGNSPVESYVPIVETVNVHMYRLRDGDIYHSRSTTFLNRDLIRRQLRVNY